MQSNEHLPVERFALNSLGVGVLTVDAEGRVVSLSGWAEKLTGWSAGDAIGQPVQEVFSLTTDLLAAEVDLEIEHRDPAAEPVREDGLLVRSDGRTVPIEYTVTRLPDGAQIDAQVVIAFRDTGDRRLMALQIARIASHDQLTGLLNRQAFVEHIEQAIADGSTTFLMFMDMDQFKLINDTSGHEAGDDLLLWVSALLREAVGSKDVLARLGGDEFAILLRRPTLRKTLDFVEALQDRLRQFCFTWDGKTFSVSASFGVVLVSAELRTASRALSAADQACYMAKDRGRGSVQVYRRDDADFAQRRDEMSWVGRINQELNSGKSRLFGQQIVPLSRRASRGLSFEVLLRLGGSGGTLQPPGDLIRAAERFGLMSTVDRWVVRNALKTLRCFSEDALRRTSRCFINLSGLSLRDASVLDCIRAQLAETGIPPHKLCFEITETAAVENLEQARWLIQELGSIGCKLALDDFGTGAASYGYLRDLPVQYLKIDGSFVEAMSTTSLDRALVESINQISHLLGMETIAESVSDFETLGRLRDIGVDYVQGFWISHPQPAENLARVAMEGPMA